MLVNYYSIEKDIIMSKWLEPTATEIRFGFEVTLYVMNR